MAASSYDSVLELLKQGAVIEAQERFNALHERALMLQGKKAQPHHEMRTLEVEPGSRGRAVPDGVVCYLVENGKRSGPYCRRCRDRESHWVRLRAVGAVTYVCVACKSEYARHLCG